MSDLGNGVCELFTLDGVVCLSGLFTVAAVDNIDYIPKCCNSEGFISWHRHFTCAVFFSCIRSSLFNTLKSRFLLQKNLCMHSPSKFSGPAMSVVHIRDMTSLPEEHPEVLAEFCAGKFAVHKKNQQVSMVTSCYSQSIWGSNWIDNIVLWH